MENSKPKAHSNAQSLSVHLNESDASPIIMYTSEDNTISLDVKLENDTVWLSQAQMALLFGRNRTVIARHISNCFNEGELDKNITCAKFAHMGVKEGELEGKSNMQNLHITFSRYKPTKV